MRFFFLWFRLSIKRQLRSGAFWCCSIFLVLLVGTFAWMMPDSQPVSMQVGLLDRSGMSYTQDAIAQLTQNEDFRFVLYAADDADSMRDDLIRGTLHCAYIWEVSGADVPITVYETDASFMRAVMDELVMAAWFEARAVPLTEQLMDQFGVAAAVPVADALRRSQQETPLAVHFEYTGTAGAMPVRGIDAYPLFYALLICVFLLFSVLLPLLEGTPAPVFTGVPGRRFAPACARALLLGGVLLLADTAAAAFMQVTYSVAARLVMIAILAVFAACIAPLVNRLRKFSAVILLLLPMWMAVSIVFSGALLDPALFGAAGALRFLSPAWHLLRLMSAIG